MCVCVCIWLGLKKLSFDEERAHDQQFYRKSYKLESFKKKKMALLTIIQEICLTIYGKKI